MQWLRFIAIVALLQLSKTSESEQPRIEDYFSKDWIIDGNNTLLYSRSFNRHREFGYVTCNNADKICKINVVHADSTDYRTRTCGLRYDLISGKTGDLALYLPDDQDIDSEQVVQVWWLKGNVSSDTRVTVLHLRSCMNAGFDITPVTGHPSGSRVVAYSYPNFELVYNDAFKRDKRVRFVSFVDRRYRRAWNLNVDHKYMYGERGVESDSSRGFFYVATNGEPDWRLKVMYADSSAREVKKLGVIEDLKDPSRMYPKTSGAHGKYGLCWKNLERGNRVNCTQFKNDGRRSINEMSLELTETVDWLAVHNLEETAMLVVTGRCSHDKCNDFDVSKVNPDGRASVPFKISNLNAVCPKAPFDLTMDVVEDLDKHLICFNFVCLSSRYEETTAEKLSTTMQYRRHCINKHFIEMIV